MAINTFPGFLMGSGVDSLSSATYLCSAQPPQCIKHIPVLSSCLYLKCLSVSVPLQIFFFLSRSDSKLICSCKHCKSSPWSEWDLNILVFLWTLKVPQPRAPDPHNIERTQGIRYRVVWLCVRYWVPLPPHVLDWQLSTHGRATSLPSEFPVALTCWAQALQRSQLTVASLGPQCHSFSRLSRRERLNCWL